MRVGIWWPIRRAVQVFQRQFLASVQHVQQQPAVSVIVVNRLDYPKIGRELDEPFAVSRRQPNVGDCGVVGMRRIHCEVRHSVDPLVTARRAESLAFSERLPRCDFQSD